MIDFTGKTVLVTGGTGSFGKAFARYVLANSRPKRLIIFSRDELRQYQMQQELDAPCLRFFIGDVRDRERLDRAFAGVEYVVHAAALKQVPACEYNPFEAIRTNVLGAENIINAAIDNGVRKVVALSTDKAANPINLYGATKLCSDKLFIAGNAYVGSRDSRFSVVRYGNVMGSRGSVIPFFRSCRQSGAVPITDLRMTRFWITLEQAVEFVLESFERMLGGEIFVPKIPSMKIVDLAEAIAPGCRHEIVGIRPGEKLHEIMIPYDEARNSLEYERHYVIQPQFDWWASVRKRLNGGSPLPENFSYRSDNNTQWLSVEELRGLAEPLA
ncbi:MAG: UDP-N-acetylglucosamine 4,6-dehydratase (inverting) [Deltaproteobacteria bacterium]|nr:UDP-N-acetylglucosamine 4,6-dehydratase (inverting) [Deltaproteobacteria bacterium]